MTLLLCICISLFSFHHCTILRHHLLSSSWKSKHLNFQFHSMQTLCQLEATSTPSCASLLTIHALPWCNRSSNKLVTISQNFCSRKYSWNNNTALPWELKDNCMSLWHCCFISFTLHFWFPPESTFFLSLPFFAHIYFWLNLTLCLCISQITWSTLPLPNGNRHCCYLRKWKK